MVQLKVKINNVQYFLDTYETDPVKLNLSIEDIVTTSATSIFSRPFRVPSNSNNNKFLKNVFLINGLDFDVTVKVEAEILLDGALLHSGHIRLQKIYISDLEDRIDYELLFLGETRDLASKIGEKKLKDITLTGLDHIPTYANITSSWSNGLLNGDVVYPLVDFGNTYVSEDGVNVPAQPTMTNSTNVSDKSFKTSANAIEVDRFRPIVRVKRILFQIFADAGFTYESEFIDGLTNLYLTAFGNEEIVSIDINKTSNNIVEAKTSTAFSYVPSYGRVIYPVKVSDAGGNFILQEYYVAPANGTYTFKVDADLSGLSGDYVANIELTKWSADLSTTSAIVGPEFTSQYLTFEHTLLLTADERISVGLNVLQDGLPSSFLMTSTFKCTSAPGNIQLGNLLGNDYKQIDFLKDLMTMFRLVLVPDKNKPKNFIIEPWSDYIGTKQSQIVDWSPYVDHNKDILVEPLFDTQTKLIEFTTGESGDWVNKYHKDSVGKNYGYYEFVATDNDGNINDLLAGKKEIKLTTPTILPMNINSNTAPNVELFTIPQLFTYSGSENRERKPIKPKPFFVGYNGLKNNPVDFNWFLKNGATAVQQIKFPMISNVLTVNGENTYLNWGEDTTYSKYKDNISPTFSSTTLFGKYWVKYIGELYNKYSRRVTLYMKFNSDLLLDFDFSDVIFIDGVYYYVESINDVVVGEESIAKVVLIKLNNYNPDIINPIVWTLKENIDFPGFPSAIYIDANMQIFVNGVQIVNQTSNGGGGLQFLKGDIIKVVYTHLASSGMTANVINPKLKLKVTTDEAGDDYEPIIVTEIKDITTGVDNSFTYEFEATDDILIELTVEGEFASPVINSVSTSCVQYAGTGQINVAISGGSGLYQYSNDDGATYEPATSATTYTFSGLANGTYKVKVKSVIDNKVTAHTSNTPIACITAPTISSTPSTCNPYEGSAAITVNIIDGIGGFQYSIDNGATFSSTTSSRTFTTPSSLSDGTYSIKVKDVATNFIFPTTGQTVVIDCPKVISFTSVSPSCVLYEGSGRIAISVTGGTGTYQYSINGGSTFGASTTATSQTFTSLADGTYNVRVKDVGTGVVFTFGDVTVDCPAQLGGTYTTACGTDSGIGTVFITATGGSGNYSYKVLNTANSTTITSSLSTISGLDSFGTYQFFVVDVTLNTEVYIGQHTFNCTTTTTTTTLPPLTVTNGAVSCVSGAGNFTSTFSGGSGQYAWTAIGTSQANAAAAVNGTSGSRDTVTGNSYDWSAIPNGTYWVAVMDSLGNVSVQNTSVVINCDTTTTTTTTLPPATCWKLDFVPAGGGTASYIDDFGNTINLNIPSQDEGLCYTICVSTMISNDVGFVPLDLPCSDSGCNC